MADVSADDFLSAAKSVLDRFHSRFHSRFHIKKFSETQQDSILNFLKGKDVLISQPKALAEFVFFSPS